MNTNPHAQVRSVAASTMEREERAMLLIERDIADREARVASREKMLTERETKVRGNVCMEGMVRGLVDC